MSSSAESPAVVRPADRDLYLNRDVLFREGLLKLLAIKDSDIRILTLEQARDALARLLIRSPISGAAATPRCAEAQAPEK